MAWYVLACSVFRRWLISIQVGPRLWPLKQHSSTSCYLFGHLDQISLQLQDVSELFLHFEHHTNLSTVTIFVAATLLIFVMPNTVFAWFEYVSSIIKILLFLLIIFTSLAIIGGAGAQGPLDGSYWRDLPVFKNGFSVSFNQ